MGQCSSIVRRWPTRVTVALSSAGWLSACTLFTSLDGLTDGAETELDGSRDSAREEQPDGVAGPRTYASEVLADRPLAYWRLGEDGGSTARDQIGTVNTGICEGATFGAPGAISADPDTAVQLSVGGCSVGQAFPFAGMQPFSIEAWAKPTVADSQPRSIVARDFHNGSTFHQGYALWFGSGGLGFTRYLDGVPQGPTRTQGLVLNAWSHVVATFDGTTMLLYVDGGLSAPAVAATLAVAPSDSTKFCIGCRSGGYRWAGTLDEVALYDFALPPERVLAHYDVGTRAKD